MITHFFDTPYSSNNNVCTISCLMRSAAHSPQLAVLRLESSVSILTLLPGRSTQKLRRQQEEYFIDSLRILTENPSQSPISFPPDSTLGAHWQPRLPTPASRYLLQNKLIQCLTLVTTLVDTVSNDFVRRLPGARAPRGTNAKNCTCASARVN